MFRNLPRIIFPKKFKIILVSDLFQKLSLKILKLCFEKSLPLKKPFNLNLKQNEKHTETPHR